MKKINLSYFLIEQSFLVRHLLFLKQDLADPWPILSAHVGRLLPYLSYSCSSEDPVYNVCWKTCLLQHFSSDSVAQAYQVQETF